MSSRPIIVTLVLAIVLAAAVLIVVGVRRGGAGPGAGGATTIAPGEAIAAFAAGRTVGLTLRPPGANAGEIALRRPDADSPLWEIRLGGEGAMWWRADPARVRAALEILTTARAAAAVPRDARSPADGVTLTVRQADGATQLFRFAPRTLGGQGVVEVSDLAPASSTDRPVRLAIVSDSLHGFFTPAGLREWRDRVLIPDAGEAARLRLVSEAGTIALNRIKGRWGMTEPVAAPADAVAVGSLVATLAGLKVERFVDEALTPAAAQSLQEPRAKVALEYDRASAPLARRDLAIGAPADAAGRQVLVSLDGGQTAVVIEALPLATLRAVPATYIASVATQTASADVGMVMIEPAAADPAGPRGMGFRRTLEGWVELRPDGAEVLLTGDGSTGVNNLIAFLSAQPAKDVVLAEPEGYRRLGELRLMTTGGEPLDVIEFATAKETPVVLKTGAVYRRYLNTHALLAPYYGAQLKPADPAANPADMNK